MTMLNPLLCADFLRAFNFLGLGEKSTSQDIWRAAQQQTLFFSNYCKERGIPAHAVALVFGVTEPFNNHEEAALLGARNMVEALTNDTTGVITDEI